MKRIAFALVALLFAASGVMAQSASTDAAATETASTSTKTAVYTLQKTDDGYQLEGQEQAPATQKEGLYNAVEQANGNGVAAKPACSGKKAEAASGCCSKKGGAAAASASAGCSKDAAAAKAACGEKAQASAGKACCSKGGHGKKPQ